MNKFIKYINKYLTPIKNIILYIIGKIQSFYLISKYCNKLEKNYLIYCNYCKKKCNNDQIIYCIYDKQFCTINCRYLFLSNIV
jgi:hypothetical protein